MVLAGSAASDAAPGVLGFLVVAGMGVILYFLFRSMTKHLRKVSVDPRQDPAAASGSGAAGGVAAGGGSTGSKGIPASKVSTGSKVSPGSKVSTGSMFVNALATPGGSADTSSSAADS